MKREDEDTHWMLHFLNEPICGLPLSARAMRRWRKGSLVNEETQVTCPKCLETLWRQGREERVATAKTATHYQVGEGEPLTICGFRIEEQPPTRKRKEVTCERCLSALTRVGEQLTAHYATGKTTAPGGEGEEGEHDGRT